MHTDRNMHTQIVPGPSVAPKTLNVKDNKQINYYAINFQGSEKCILCIPMQKLLVKASYVIIVRL